MKGYFSHRVDEEGVVFWVPAGCVACRAPSLAPCCRGAVPSSGGTFSGGGTGPANTKWYQPKTPYKLY